MGTGRSDAHVLAVLPAHGARRGRLRAARLALRGPRPERVRALPPDARGDRARARRARPAADRAGRLGRSRRRDHERAARAQHAAALRAGQRRAAHDRHGPRGGLLQRAVLGRRARRLHPLRRRPGQLPGRAAAQRRRHGRPVGAVVALHPDDRLRRGADDVLRDRLARRALGRRADQRRGRRGRRPAPGLLPGGVVEPATSARSSRGPGRRDASRWTVPTSTAMRSRSASRRRRRAAI